MLVGVSDVVIFGSQLLQEAVEKVNFIGQKYKVAQDRQKNYADVRRKEQEFQVGDSVFLKVSPTKVTIRFGFSGILEPRCIGPFDIIARIGD